MEKVKVRRKKKKERSPRQQRRAFRKEHGSLPYARARVRFLRTAPRKARLVADMIRGINLQDALESLQFSERAAAIPIRRLLQSAAANAVGLEKLNSDKLFVAEIWVDGGPIIKRFMPRAMGRASRINKRTSHVTVVLREREED